MYRMLVLAVLFSAFAAEAAEDKSHFAPGVVADAEALRDAALEGSGAWDILESLTTEVGARIAGSEAEARARLWAEAKFRELGFDKVWVETFTMQGWLRVSATARVLSPFPHDMAVTSLGLSTSTPAGGIEAEVIHFATVEDLIAAEDGAADGKIVFISNRMERTRNGAGYGPAVRARSIGASEAVKKGAVALVIRSIGTDDHRNPHTGAMRYEEGVPRIAAAAISNPDADMLVHQFERGGPVRMHLTVINRDMGEVTSGNVIAEFTGSEAPDELVVIGGHLDSWDLGTGAIDDGAGIAITMAAGRMIGRAENRPRRTIRVIAFGAEEVGLYGGRAYLEAHQSELNLHVIGAESDFGSGRIYRFSPNVSEDALPVMAEIAGVLAPLGIELGDNDGGAGPDLGPMQRAGMAAAGLSQDGTLYFDLHHTADDTLDKVSPEDLDQNVAAYVAFAFLAANYDGSFGNSRAAE